MKQESSEEAATRLGAHIKELRQARNLGPRELARRAGMNSGALVHIENGRRFAKPATLKAIATALDIPASDLFMVAGHLTPSDLPSMSTYLRIQHGNLSDETVASINEYIRRLVSEEGLDPNGPELLEDETEQLSRE